MKCSVPDCDEDAKYRVILYDIYPYPQRTGHIFFETDSTCFHLCSKHMIENERGADGERGPRGSMHYPFTNRDHAQGFTIYLPIDWPELSTSE